MHILLKVYVVTGTWNIWHLQESVKDGNTSILRGTTTIGEHKHDMFYPVSDQTLLIKLIKLFGGLQCRRMIVSAKVVASVSLGVSVISTLACPSCLCGSLLQCTLSLKRLSAGPGFNPQTRQNKLFQDYWRACFEINLSDR